MSPEERRALAVKAVNRLILDVEETTSWKRITRPDEYLQENKELAETIAVCIRETALLQLQNLKRLLDKQESRTPFTFGPDSPNFIR